jgi:hypothetical protein
MRAQPVNTELLPGVSPKPGPTIGESSPEAQQALREAQKLIAPYEDDDASIGVLSDMMRGFLSGSAGDAEAEGGGSRPRTGGEAESPMEYIERSELTKAERRLNDLRKSEQADRQSGNRTRAQENMNAAMNGLAIAKSEAGTEHERRLVRKAEHDVIAEYCHSAGGGLAGAQRWREREGIQSMQSPLLKAESRRAQRRW